MNTSLGFISLTSHPFPSSPYRLCTATSSYPSPTDTTTENCLYSGHILLISEYEQGYLLQVNVLPINSNAYVFPTQSLARVTTNYSTSVDEEITGVYPISPRSQLQYQDQNNPSGGEGRIVENLLPIIILFTEMTKLQSVTIDQNQT